MMKTCLSSPWQFGIALHGSVGDHDQAMSLMICPFDHRSGDGVVVDVMDRSWERRRRSPRLPRVNDAAIVRRYLIKILSSNILADQRLKRDAQGCVSASASNHVVHANPVGFVRWIDSEEPGTRTTPNIQRDRCVVFAIAIIATVRIVPFEERL